MLRGPLDFTCVSESGQEDGGLAALVPVPHPVQSEVPPEPTLLLRPRLSCQLLQNLLTSSLPTGHLKHTVQREQEQMSRT